MKKISKSLSIVLAIMLILGAMPLSLLASATEGEAYSTSNQAWLDAGVVVSSDNLKYTGNLEAITYKTPGYVICKFDMGEGYLLTAPSVYWKARGIMNGDCWCEIYYGFSAEPDGTWYKLDSAGKRTGDPADNRAMTFDLTDEMGDGVQALYVKLITQRSGNNSWGTVYNLKVSGTKVVGSVNTDTATSIALDGLDAENAVINLGTPVSFTAFANPATISDLSTTATIVGNQDVVTVQSNGSGSYTLTPLCVGTTTIRIASVLTPTVYQDVPVTVSGIVNNYASAVETVPTEYSGEFFSVPALANVKFAQSAGSVLKYQDISFENFLGTGANILKAGVAWGAAGDQAASFDVYADGMTDFDKIATLYALPYGGSGDEQTATAQLAEALEGTHDIYVVCNTPYSAVLSLTFGNVPAGYNDFDCKFVSERSVNPVWDAQVINHTPEFNEKDALTSKQNEQAVWVWRVDAPEGKTLTAADIKVSLRNSYQTGSVIGDMDVSISTDLNKWANLIESNEETNLLDGTGVHPKDWGDNNADTWEYQGVEQDITSGAQTIYVKISILRRCGNGSVSWQYINRLAISGASADTATNFSGDANSDGINDIRDLIRFKKAAAGIAEATVADTAYFAGRYNMVNDVIYQTKKLLGCSFVVDRSRYEEKHAITIKSNLTSETPSVMEAYALEPVTENNSDDYYALNTKRIQFCLDKYGLCKLISGETYNITERLNGTAYTCLRMDKDNSLLTTTDSEKAMLSYEGTEAWYVLNISSSGSTVNNLIINQNHNYLDHGAHYDVSVVQVYGNNATIEDCVIEGGTVPEPKSLEFSEFEYNGSTGKLYSCGVYFLSNGSAGYNNTVKNSTIQNCYYGVLFGSSLTKDHNAQLQGCTVTYNRSDGITFIGYGNVDNCDVFLNGYDCMNGTYANAPIPGAGIYTQSNAGGFSLTNSRIYRNNGFNIDVNLGSNIVITGNTIYDAGWTQFPLAEGYETVAYSNGISLSLYGVHDSVITGNTVKQELDTRLDQCYAHLSTGIDVNGSFGYANNSVAFSLLPTGGASSVAALLAYTSTGNTLTGNTFIGNAPSSDITGYGLFIDNRCDSSNTVSDNIYTGSEVGLCDTRS